MSKGILNNNQLISSIYHQVATFDGHTGNVTAVGFHCEGKWMVSGSEDGTLKIWDIR